MFWTCVLCLVGNFGGRMLGQRLLKYSYTASALIFSYYALYVIVSRYREFMVAGADQQNIVMGRRPHHFSKGINEMTLIVKTQHYCRIKRINVSAK